MVSRTVLLSLCLLAGPAWADTPNWRGAGGGLFVDAGLGAQNEAPVPPAPDASAPAPQVVTRSAHPSRADREAAPRQEDGWDGYAEVRLLPPDQPLDELITRIAAETGLDPKLLHALVIVESAYDPGAVSPVGARGLTQLMPGTARDLGVRDAFDMEQNLRGGAQYLAIQIGRFGDLRLALAAYNSGPGRVARLGRVPDIAETQGYVRDAIDCYLALSAGRGIRHRRQCRAR
jgi:soluble lytic murein transglycosylase-like protein